MTPLPFKNKRLPWRIVIPAKLNGGKRKVEYFRDKQAAKDRIKEVELDGRSAVTRLGTSRTAKERDEVARLVEYASRKFDGDVSKIFTAIDLLEKKLSLAPITVTEAIKAYDLVREKRCADGFIGKRTLKQDRYRLRKLEREFGPVQMSELDNPILMEFFGKFKPKFRLTLYRTIRAFIKWAHLKKKYIAEDPLAEVQPKTEIGEDGVNKEYYRVETFRRMLRIAAGLEAPKPGAEKTREFIDLLPWFVVSGFGGLRSCEAFRTSLQHDAVRKSDLYFDWANPMLNVREEVAKQTNRGEGEADGRPIDADFVIQAIKDWLSLVPVNDGPFLVPCTEKQIMARKKKFTKATGIKFLKNGFRNSFATYGLCYSGLVGLGLIAKLMGNAEAVARKHYAHVLPAETGKAWFNLRPFESVQQLNRKQA